MAQSAPPRVSVLLAVRDGASFLVDDVMSVLAEKQEEYGDAFVREAFALLYRPRAVVPIQRSTWLARNIRLLHDAFWSTTLLEVARMRLRQDDQELR